MEELIRAQDIIEKLKKSKSFDILYDPQSPEVIIKKLSKI